MKLITFLFTACIIQISANTYSQEQRISMSLKNYPLEKVFQEIEKQTNFRFLYRLENVENETADINASNNTVDQVLKKLLDNRDITYRILENNLIVITPAESLQTIKVSGTVTDASTREPIPGVNVIIEGTTIGGVTDMNGKFNLDVPSENSVLVFSYLGYVTERVAVAGRSAFDINLVADIKSLDEVIVIGYGTKIRKEVTGSIAKVSNLEISRNISSDVTGALQGRSAGVQITQQGGQPGSAMRVRVRGSSSINSSGDPLIVIDGVPVANTEYGGRSGLSEINSNDIESVEILKDAASAAIYGSRAANGVILITTKKGKAGKDRIEFSYEQGVTSAVNQVKFVNGDQYQQLVRESIDNRNLSGLTPLANYYIIPNNLAGQFGYDQAWLDANPTNTNWFPHIIRDGSTKKASFSMSGGNEKTLFYFSGGYEKTQGILIGNTFERYTGRMNVDHSISRILKTGANIYLTQIVDNSNHGGFFKDAQTTLLPIYPMYAPNDPSRYFYDYPVTTMAAGAAPRDSQNPLFWRSNYMDRTRSFRSLNSVYLQLTPMKDLVIKSELGIDFRFDNSRTSKTIALFPLNAIGNQQGGGGRIGNSRFQNTNLVNTNTANYNKILGSHKIGAMLGLAAERGLSSGNTSIKEGITSEWVRIDGSKHAAGNESESEFRRVSYFSRLSYAYGGKYLVELNLRRDGSNKFAHGFRWGTFSGGSLGWIISEENFMKNVNAISLLKFRASYGQIGNDNIGNFKYLSTVYVNWNDGKYAGEQGYLLAALGNKNLTWETTHESSFGLDYGLFKNKISGSVEYYNKKSVDLLMNAPISNAYGWSYTSTMLENVGSLTNKGVEVSINANMVDNGSFKWDIDFNIARNRSVINKLFKNLGPNLPGTMSAGNVANNSTSILIEGKELGAFYLPIYAGKDPVTGAELIYEVNQTKLTNEGVYELTGNVIDATNNPSLVSPNKFLINDKSPFPKFFGGIGTALSYKGLDFNVLFTFQYGNWIYDANEFYTSYPGEGKNLRASVADNKDISFIYGANSVQSTRFLHDGSFVRLRDMQLGYSLPKSLINKIRIENLKIYVAAQNLVTWTKFNGWEPEVYRSGDTDSNVAPGIAEWQLPQVRTIQVGIKLGI